MLTRRRAVLAAGALGAGAAGAGLAWWRSRDADDAAAAAAAASFWSMRFEAPEGAPVEAAALRGRPLVLNFWATWCPPCLREMPALDRFHRDFAPQGWQVLGLAADKPEPVRHFLARSPVGFLIGLTGFGGIELSRELGNLAGGLPFTVIFTRSGAVAHRHAGETRYEQLAGWAQGIS
jgi:thiol-disulfide isomerase/thioredoxin